MRDRDYLMHDISFANLTFHLKAIPSPEEKQVATDEELVEAFTDF